MEMRDIIAGRQTGERAEDENGEDAGTGEPIVRGQEAKVMCKENIVALKNSSARRISIISRVRPVVGEMTREELQAVFANVALVKPAHTSQVTQCLAFDVSDYMPYGDPGDPSADLNLLEQMEILVDVVIQVIGKGAESVGSMARVDALHRGFKVGINAVKKCKQQCAKEMRIPSNRERIEKLINEDILVWTSALLDTSMSAGERGIHHQASSSSPLYLSRGRRRYFATSTGEGSRMRRVSVPGLTVDLPHHRPSGHRRRTKFRVLGGRPRGGAITAETARFPTQQAINDARVAALGTVRARNQGRPPQARREEV